MCVFSELSCYLLIVLFVMGPFWMLVFLCIVCYRNGLSWLCRIDDLHQHILDDIIVSTSDSCTGQKLTAGSINQSFGGTLSDMACNDVGVDFLEESCWFRVSR